MSILVKLPKQLNINPEDILDLAKYIDNNTDFELKGYDENIDYDICDVVASIECSFGPFIGVTDQWYSIEAGWKTIYIKSLEFTRTVCVYLVKVDETPYLWGFDQDAINYGLFLLSATHDKVFHLIGCGDTNYVVGVKFEEDTSIYSHLPAKLEFNTYPIDHNTQTSFAAKQMLDKAKYHDVHNLGLLITTAGAPFELKEGHGYRSMDDMVGYGIMEDIIYTAVCGTLPHQVKSKSVAIGMIMNYDDLVYDYEEMNEKFPLNWSNNVLLVRGVD